MKRAAVFPGQGAQRPGMGEDLCERFPEARELFHRADEILDFPLAETCFRAPAETIHRTDVCQPAIFLVSAATMEILRVRRGVSPDSFGAAAGLSLGEYTALWFAGALRFEDALSLTRLRGRLMQEASEAEPSGMTSVIGASREAVEAVVADLRSRGEVVCVANLNAPGQVVISGRRTALQAAEEPLRAAGARRTIPLSVAGAFHSPLMASAAGGLAARLREIDVAAARIPVISNVTAAPVTDPAEIRRNLVRQLTRPVLWEDSVRALLADGFTEFWEPGPGSVLAGLLRKIDPGAKVLGYPDAASLEGDAAP